MIAIIDYGMGNLRSVQKAFEKIGATAKVTSQPADILLADHVVLPGVGAMAPAMQKLDQAGLTDVIRTVVSKKKPFLGICLGLQLLFDRSCEGGATAGLGIIPGSVERFSSGPDGRTGKVPHMGWNQLKIQPAGRQMCQGIADGENVYFCHSYFVVPEEPNVAAALTDYGKPYVSAVARGNLWGVQFHPEKSQMAGLRLLENFAKL
jgi:imidazole glycerol-phosphate synthase subunit HisH